MSIIRSYGQSENFSKIQLKYMEERLKAREQNRLLDNNEDNISKLKKKLGIKETKKKKKLSDKEVLSLRIENMESLLKNDKFLSNVDERVLVIKKEELKKLKELL